MRAMVLAAGLGTRLRPITFDMPKPMVPVLNRPVMEHILRLLAKHGFTETIANLHWFPELIEEHFGDGSACGVSLTYSKEEALLVFFLRHPGEVLGRTRIYEAVWDERYDGLSNTLEVHVMELRKKLEAHGPRLIRTVRGRGYAFGPEPE